MSSADEPCLQRMFEEASSNSTRRRGLGCPCGARWQPEGASWCVRSVDTAEATQTARLRRKCLVPGSCLRRSWVLAVNIRSDGTWDVVRLTSPSVGGSGAACGPSPEVKPAKKPGVTGAKGSSGAIFAPLCVVVDVLAHSLGAESILDRRILQTRHKRSNCSAWLATQP